MFQIKNISKLYENEYALRDVSFKINSGLNYIIGASGSGKTTLLKIMTGMEPDYDGTILFNEEDIRTIFKSKREQLYNETIGFVWQDYNLLDGLTVLENILLPGYLKAKTDISVNKILKALKLTSLKDKKVKYLSGGQKQRVAIARELMKNPQVIIADEPTSALDKDTAQEIIDIFRDIAKHKTVIIVTHNTFFITESDSVFELDKGELISIIDKSSNKHNKIAQLSNHLKLSFHNARMIAATNVKRYKKNFGITAITSLIAAILLLITFQGAIQSTNQKSFDELITKYGEGIKDIHIVNSFTSASGTSDEDNDKPNADVKQDISGLYERYQKDERVDFVLQTQAFNDIKVKLDGKESKIETSGSVPIMDKLLSGKIPNGNERGVIVPEKFVKQMKYTNESIIGKEITFSSTIYDWKSGEPVTKNIEVKVNVAGVSSNKATYDYEGETIDYSVDDSFFFDAQTLTEIREQAEIKNENPSFIIRAKTINDTLSIQDELNKSGIVPIGQFELIEDITGLNSQTSQQSASASIMIGLLAIVMVIAVCTISSVMRKKEFIIYKLCGYQNNQITKILLVEAIMQSIATIAFMFVTSPLLNLITMNLFHVNIMSIASLITGACFIIVSVVIAYSITCIIATNAAITSVMKSGTRG